MTFRRRDRRCQAFTLLELIITLTILTAMASLGLPSLNRMMARAEFKDGVFALQAELAQTRLRSMKSGEAYLFRCRIGTNQYEIVPKTWFEQRLAQRESDFAEQRLAPNDLAGPAEVRRLEGARFSGVYLSESTGTRLRKKIALVEGETDLGSRKIGSLDLPVTQRPPIENWSDPIAFYPNGRTGNAVLFLESTGDFRYFSEVSLRGMTGTVRVSSISGLPPDSPEFPSVLPPEAFANHSPFDESNAPRVFTADEMFEQGGFTPQTDKNFSGESPTPAAASNGGRSAAIVGSLTDAEENRQRHLAVEGRSP